MLHQQMRKQDIKIVGDHHDARKLHNHFNVMSFGFPPTAFVLTTETSSHQNDSAECVADDRGHQGGQSQKGEEQGKSYIGPFFCPLHLDETPSVLGLYIVFPKPAERQEGNGKSNGPQSYQGKLRSAWCDHCSMKQRTSDANAALHGHHEAQKERA
ncbi:hypothetical protein E2320_015603 [Naja naja]|nr:hypothetical protein E2320_015603 [Naja naja]